MEAGGMCPRRVAKHQRVDWSRANRRSALKNQLLRFPQRKNGVEASPWNCKVSWNIRGTSMRLAIVILAGLSIAGAAHAQFQPIQPIPPIPGIPRIPGPKAAQPFKPYEPPKASADPFSPAGQAERERRAAAAERARANGVFSPAGEAKRERAQARHNAEINPF